MNYSNIQKSARLIMVAAGLLTASQGWGAEFWLRTGTTTNTMPDGRQVVMWGFGLDTPATAATATSVVDNADGPATVTIAGAWTASTSTPGFWASNYLHDGNTGKGTKSVTFTPNLPAEGSYEVAIWYPAAGNRATAVPVDIVSAAGTTTVLVNQRINGSMWVALATNTFAAGSTGSVRIRTDGTTDGFVVADAVRFMPVAGAGPVTVPGPQLSVASNDTLIVHLRNTLPEPTSFVIPGQYNYKSLTPVFHSGGAYDGRVRSLTYEAAALTGTATYCWTTVQAGTFLYHSATHPAAQVQMGLYGALSVVAPGPAVYAGVPYNSSVTLLFSEIDPDVHDAIATNSFGPGPAFLQSDFTNAAALLAQITASPAPVAAFVAGQLSGSATALASDLNTLIGGPSIYNPTLFPDTVLSPAVVKLLTLTSSPSQDYPITGAPFNGNLVRMNRLLLQDGLRSVGIILPPVKMMTSTIRSYAQYFMINGQPYTNGVAPIYAGTAGSTILLRLLNAGTDAHVPTLNNAGDMRLQGEDGQQAPYVRSTSAVFMPALKTIDALWTPAVAGTNAIYDRRLGLVNGLQSPGGMLAYLTVSASNAPAAGPAILIPPANVIAFVGQSATFSVIASHVGTPTYQWQLNGVNIAGATAVTYTIAAVSTTNLGSYSVVVTDGLLSTISAAAVLTVVTQPAPGTNVVTDGAAATFAVTNLGPAAVTYQWQKDGVAIAGATNSSYTFFANYATDNGHRYSVVANGPGGPATSATALLTVTPIAPAIVTPPANQIVPDLGTATFTVVATGSKLTYQWQRQSGAFVNIPGATNSSYSFQVSYSNDNGAVFRVVVSRSGAAPVASASATLTVIPLPGPQITTQPVNTLATYGLPTNLFVVAQASGTLGYQWQKSNTATHAWTPVTAAGGISGVSASTLSFSALATTNSGNNGNYRVVVTSTGTGAGSVTSTVASFTIVTLAPTIVTPPANVITNGGAPDVSFTVSATAFPAPTYQWQRLGNNGVWANLANSGAYAGVNTPTLTVASGAAVITVANAGSYRVVVSNPGGQTMATGTLTVVQSFIGGQVPTIPAAGGTATPYPALTANVPAFTGASVKHTTVSLTLTHPEPYDVNCLLTTPGTVPARKVEFMAAIGPYQQEHEIVVSNVNVVSLYSYPVTNAVLTFDDAAPTPAPTLYPLYSGTFQPTVATPVVAFPSPAPALPYATLLGNFNGFTQPGAGAWRLFVNDVAQDIPTTGNDGIITTWSLTLTVGP